MAASGEGKQQHAVVNSMTCIASSVVMNALGVTVAVVSGLSCQAHDMTSVVHSWLVLFGSSVYIACTGQHSTATSESDLKSASV